jgi:conjugative relaxase-like TrwC/TraI family protein
MIRFSDVISIKRQSSPQNAARYFKDHLSRDDYYADRQQTRGRWFGQGCQALGLDSQAPVRQEDFVALCKGLRPDDHSRLTQRANTNRRCLYDLTVSAPKSVSIMALLAADERLITAHERAVAATLEAAETLAQTRVRKGAAVDTEQSRLTGSIVAARFQHQESRALDPQLHTHCVVFNVTYDPVEKRLKALQAQPFYDHAKDLTGLYREHLAQSLHALGYETYHDRHRCIQIRGVDASLMAQFSKRSAQRDALVALKEQELGRPLTKREVSKVVHEHRAKKQKRIDPQALRKVQLEQLSPEARQSLQQLKQRALVVCAGPRQPVAAHRQPAFAPVCPAAGPNWITAVRLALLANRTMKIDYYLFSPRLSLPERILWAARFVRQAQRTASVLRRGQRRGQRGISR